ncbi:hypothetical protein YTPLAS18_23590 [Nitrospira sp.]|nr:hypothetical protein YTPLAS18_23590 [Nitrospira sp.]
MLDINALVILVMLCALALPLWDVRYAHTRRYIGPFEQHVHSFLQVLPVMAVSFVSLLYWGQFLALFGLGPEPTRFEFTSKPDPLSSTYLLGLFFSIVCFVVIPYAEELRRCIVTARKPTRAAPLSLPGGEDLVWKPRVPRTGGKGGLCRGSSDVRPRHWGGHQGEDCGVVSG